MIDALRAVAALSVVVFHSFIAAYTHEETQKYWNYFDLGYFGVTLFFLLSGFLIQRSAQRTSIGHFWVRRVFRLFPLYWVSVLCALIFAPLLDIGSVSAARVLANLTMLQRFLGYPDLMEIYWTLSLELLFYMLATVIVLLNAQVKVPLILALLLAGALLTDGIIPLLTQGAVSPAASAAPVRVFANLATLLFGYMVSYTQSGGRLGRAWWVSIWCLWLVVTALYGVTGFPGDMVARASAFIAFFLGLTWRRRVFAPLAWLGKISYSLYLLHIFVINSLVHRDGVPMRWAWWIALSIGVAGISYYLIEQPGIRLGERVRRLLPVRPGPRAGQGPACPPGGRAP